MDYEVPVYERDVVDRWGRRERNSPLKSRSEVLRIPSAPSLMSFRVSLMSGDKLRNHQKALSPPPARHVGSSCRIDTNCTPTDARPELPKALGDSLSAEM